ncbi:MAG: hypothetical protein Q4E09_01505 [Eubacteriales bacterium]|nr:hypothetical protein [Eubacteriales bacterium]
MTLKPNNLTQVYIELCSAEQMLHRASPYSAAYDLRSREELWLSPGETKAIPTGVKMALPPGFELEVRPRSGLSLKSRLRLANSPGTIDADFRGELMIIMENRFCQSEIPQIIAANSLLLERFGPIAEILSLEAYLKTKSADKNITLPEELSSSLVYLDQAGNLWGTEHILAQERVAQALVKSLQEVSFNLVESVAEIGSDRGGGFGHSGRI